MHEGHHVQWRLPRDIRAPSFGLDVISPSGCVRDSAAGIHVDVRDSRLLRQIVSIGSP